MLTRPLQLSSKLRPVPRNVDALHFVNAGLLALFFFLFGSRFVLSPGVRLNASSLPVVTTALEGAVPTTLDLNITLSGQYFKNNGYVSLADLKLWLAAEAKRNPGATLLIKADRNISMELISSAASAASEVGLKVQYAAIPNAPPEEGTR